MSAHDADVVIVGAGFAGAIVAKQLAAAGLHVVILEAGTAQGLRPGGYDAFVDDYYTAPIKVPNAPYPLNKNAPQPSVMDVSPPFPMTRGYFVQLGPMPFSSDSTRTMGGTGLHWTGETPRLCPSDFKLRSTYGHGVDWPIGYDDLMPYYAMADREIGVAAEVEDQAHHGIHFAPGYVFPMHRIPTSWLDHRLTARLSGMQFPVDGTPYPVSLTPVPQARNSTPNARYDGGRGYVPVGATGDATGGLRCEGNASCVPICPAQAKYNPLKTLLALPHERVHIRAQHVASRVLFDESGRVTGIECKHYRDEKSPEHTVEIVRGRTYVLAAHAIENAKLLLASGAARTSDQVGRNLMDHPYLLSWALLPERVGTFRGPAASSSLVTLVDGDFRQRAAASRVQIGNWGWEFATGAPYGDVDDAVGAGLFGRALRARLFDRVQRQLTFGTMVEQDPSARNRVVIDPEYRDRIGNFRPVIQYHLSDYTKNGIALARRLSRAVFAQLGAQDFTSYSAKDAQYFVHEGEGYSWRGSGHTIGTHRMGLSPRDSVVDSWQRCWDHPNLFAAGAGSLPTIGTSNPTITLSALAFRTAEAIVGDLR